VYALSPSGDSVVAAMPTGGFAQWAVRHVPYSNKLYVGDVNTGVVTVIDCNTNVVADTFYAGDQVSGLVCDTLRAKVYATGWGERCVWLIDPLHDSVTGSVPLPGTGLDVLCWNQVNSRAYVRGDFCVVYVIRDTTNGLSEGAAERAGMPRLCPSHIARSISLNHGLSADLWDASGRQMARLAPGASDISRIPTGVYCLRATGERWTQKIVISR
jgi:hypothetical protein